MAKAGRGSDQFPLRLPDGLRDRIKTSAERNGRSMNAEIVQALEQMFPAQPTLEEVIDSVHEAIGLANSARSLPYREVLVKALDQLSERLTSGLEFDQFRSHTLPTHAARNRDFLDRWRRWKRAGEYGVEQSDLERELDRGMFGNLDRSKSRWILKLFEKGRFEDAMNVIGFDGVKFREPDSAYKAIEEYIRKRYEREWGDPAVAIEPWEDFS